MAETFAKAVYEIVEKIPKGKVAAYGQIAKMLGKPRGAREVGWAMSNCPEGLPWHRVVMADGTIAGGQWSELRRAMLEDDDVEFRLDGRVNMKNCQWEK